MAKARPGIFKDGKKWRVKTQVTVDNEIFKIHKRGFNTENEAYIFKINAISEITTREKLSGYKSFDDLINAYFEFKKGQVRDTYIYTNRVIVNKHLGMYKNIQIYKLAEYDQLKSIIAEIDKKSVVISKKNTIIRILKEMLEFSFNRGLITTENFKNVQMILIPLKDNKVEISKNIEILSREQYKAFLDVMPNKSMHKVLFTLWGQTGLRIGEIRALQPIHIDNINNRIIIRQQAVTKLGVGSTKITPPKTSKSNRSILVSKELINEILEMIAILEIKDNQFIFNAKSKDIPLSENQIRRIQLKYSNMANVPYIKPHGIRHSNTSWLLSNISKLDEIGLVSERLGHSSKKMTLDIYFHINKQDNQNFLNILDF